MVLKMAACPEQVPTAAVPPSRAAARFSNTATVGLRMSCQPYLVDLIEITVKVFDLRWKLCYKSILPPQWRIRVWHERYL